MGRLILIPTPLGNLADLAPRSREWLTSVDVLWSEDTRTTGKLLAKLELKAPSMQALHDHNERQQVDRVLRSLEGDTHVGLVSEAGTPLVSDPGFLVVKAAIAAGHEVISIPGPSAVPTALAGSGLPVDRFGFFGFPPRASGKRKSWLAELATRPETLVFYESPRRVLALLKDLEEVFGERQCALAVNLSKKGERFVRGSFADVVQTLSEDDEVRGELTLVVDGHAGDDLDERWKRGERAIERLSRDGCSPSAIRDVVAELLELPRRDVYQRALRLQEEE